MGKKVSPHFYYHSNIKISNIIKSSVQYKLNLMDTNSIVLPQVELLDKEHYAHFVRNLTQADIDQITLLDFEEDPVLPPKLPSAFLLDLLVDPKVAKDFAANFEELYVERWAHHGPIKSKIIWYGQIARLVASQWLGPLFSLVDKVKKLVGS